MRARDHIKRLRTHSGSLKALPGRVLWASSLLGLLVALLFPHHGTGQAAPSSCATLSPPMPHLGAPRHVRFGVYPGGEAGTIGYSAAVMPNDPQARMDALDGLRGSSSRQFVLHLYTAFRRRWDAPDRKLASDVSQFTRHGFLVEIVARYEPVNGSDVPGYVEYLKQLVNRYGPNPRVVALQVANEANLPGAPSAADGAFPDARAALVAGVIAAHAHAAYWHYPQLKVGFNWAYNGDPAKAIAFWNGLGNGTGPWWVKSVDWVGLDIYPGTFDGSPQPSSSAVRTLMTRALTVLRSCLMPSANLGRGVPLRVSENGYPTGAGRPDAEQVRVMRTAVSTVERLAARLNISDYRWFDLRDANSTDGSFESHYGLLRDDYSRKPAYDVYRGLIASAPAR